MSDKLLFQSGSSAVENKGKDALKLLAGVLDKNPDIDILVEGHTDNVPIKTSVYKDNWDLSVARATSIVRILTNDYKIAPTRMTASGKGEYFPKVDNETPEGRAKNRRTEIILSPKLDELMKLLKI
jgi:chemotaxis protein MotB